MKATSLLPLACGLAMLGCGGARSVDDVAVERALDYVRVGACRVNGVPSQCGEVTTRPEWTVQATSGCRAPRMSPVGVECTGGSRLIVQEVRHYNCATREVDEIAYASCCPASPLADVVWTQPSAAVFFTFPMGPLDEPQLDSWEDHMFEYFVPVAERSYDLMQVPVEWLAELDFHVHSPEATELFCTFGTRDPQGDVISWPVLGARCRREEDALVGADR